MPAPTQGDTSWQVMCSSAQATMPGVQSFYNIGPVQTSYDAALLFCQNMMNPAAPCRIVGLQTGNFVQLLDGTG